MSDDAFLREVSEDLRRARLEALWKRYGRYVIMACVALVIAVAGNKAWQYWQLSRSQEAGAAYMAAMKLLEGGETTQADEAFSTLIELGGHDGFAQLARLQRAALLAENASDREAAVAAFDAIAADPDMPQGFRQLARIRAAYLLVAHVSPARLEERLSGFDDPMNPWRFMVSELRAISALRDGDLRRAEGSLRALLTENDLPPALRQRAQAFIAALEPQLSGK